MPLLTNPTGERKVIMNPENIEIVLVHTTHSGNIGGVARAMKNMGLSDLALVDPKKFPHKDATARASGAVDVLKRPIALLALTAVQLAGLTALSTCSCSR